MTVLEASAVRRSVCPAVRPTQSRARPTSRRPCTRTLRSLPLKSCPRPVCLYARPAAQERLARSYRPELLPGACVTPSNHVPVLRPEDPCVHLVEGIHNAAQEYARIEHHDRLIHLPVGFVDSSRPLAISGWVWFVFLSVGARLPGAHRPGYTLRRADTSSRGDIRRSNAQGVRNDR